MAKQSERFYVIEERNVWHDCDTAATHEKTVRDVATWRPMVEYLASTALVEDKGTEGFTEYVVFRQTPFGRDPTSMVKIRGFVGGFCLDLEVEGAPIDSDYFDNDKCDKVDLAIRILNALDDEEEDEED